VSVTTDQVSVAWRYRELGVAAPYLRGTFLCPVTLADGSDGLVCTETADDSAIAALEFALDTKLPRVIKPEAEFLAAIDELFPPEPVAPAPETASPPDTNNLTSDDDIVTVRRRHLDAC
jgi:hypothetical protein